MNTNKLLTGTLIGFVVFFLLGWLLYGTLLKDTMASMMPGMASIERAEADMDWAAMILGHLALGLLFAYVFEKWAGIRTFSGGLIGGATMGFLFCFAIDCIMLGTTTLATWGGVIMDSVVFAVISGLTGGVIGWWLGYKRTGAMAMG